MNISRHTAVIAFITLVAGAGTQAADAQPMKLPPPPKPIVTTLPLNAQVSPSGVYVPTNKSGNVGVTVGPLANPQPGEKGGSVSLTIKTP